MPGDEPGPSVADVLSHGGWLLHDPRVEANRHPDSFAMPTPAELRAIAPGSMVRAIFILADQTDEVRDGTGPWTADGRPSLTAARERMWAWVVEANRDDCVCLLDSVPMATHTRLRPMAAVRIPLTHIIATENQVPPEGREWFEALRAAYDILPEEAAAEPVAAERDPVIRFGQQEVCDRAGVRPHRPWEFARVLASTNLGDDLWPVHGGRFPPQPDRGDAGWVVWAGFGDMEDARTAVGFDVLTVQDLRGLRPVVSQYLALPPGWAFSLPDADHDDVYEAEFSD